jgi:hypothetical protein
MRLWIIIVVSVLTAPMVLSKLAAQRPAPLEQVQWINPAVKDLLEK